MHINNSLINNYTYSYTQQMQKFQNTQDEAVKVAEVQEQAFVPSKHGKSLSMITSMSTQKEKLVSNKNKLISETLANGGSLTDIEAELAAYEEQLHNLEDKLNEEAMKKQELLARQTKADPKIYSKNAVLTNKDDKSSDIATDI